MADNKPAQPFKVGDRVKIRYWPKLRARIVEERGALGPGGALVYRIRIAGKPKPSYVEVREDQLIPVPPAPEGEPGSSARRRTANEPRGERRPEAGARTTGAERIRIKEANMPLYLVVQPPGRDDGRGERWDNTWLDDNRLQRITTTTRIGELCEDAQCNDQRVYIHRCRWRDGGYDRPVICCSVKVESVSFEDGKARVTFKDVERLPDVPTSYSPRRGESYYWLDEPPMADES